QWHALTSAKLTGDDIAQRRYRIDFTGGVDVSTFFLRNGGFFSETSELGILLSRTSDAAAPPRIEFEKLEGISASP
ncbi:MAG: nematoblast specific protein, partial [Prosthecobacter sp.]